MMQKIWHAIAGPDFESKKKDPLLFPGKASPELLAKMPPALVWEDEFDMYITPATRFAHKLRTAGVQFPRCDHPFHNQQDLEDQEVQVHQFFRLLQQRRLLYLPCFQRNLWLH